MFINTLPILSFLIISQMLCAADGYVKRNIFPQFLANKTIAGIMGAIILFWGLFQFYENFNYFIYQFKYNYISVVLRLVIILYFIGAGFILTFKGFGKYLFTKSAKSANNYETTNDRVLNAQSLFARIGLVLIIITLVNYLLSIFQYNI